MSNQKTSEKVLGMIWEQPTQQRPSLKAVTQRLFQARKAQQWLEKCSHQ